ncbi:tRNA binding domain protein [Ichthyophthirius multifiliis]|uniref:tRNA binding domain protein n=1 Tax=Ichthyophthirius multifiliis TaxID=5932 RepID=G0R581_ICHMU|nr:tRNA binding domain protein [Ichthyophthirius multifiliis]EGR27374.1 tRNA binding domain protein [Ichthyophthirius multifiliis]|eukprot:XP_004024258.1 tRNA binding domain protein [Ichthyophthirius multifiliis]
MVLCASNADNTSVEILRPHADSQIGERVFLEGHENLFVQDLQPVLNPKKKILETCSLDLKTDAESNATFQGYKWLTKAGCIKAQLLSNAQIS